MPASIIDYPGEVDTWPLVHPYPGVDYLAYAMGASSFNGSLADSFNKLIVEAGRNEHTKLFI